MVPPPSSWGQLSEEISPSEAQLQSMKGCVGKARRLEELLRDLDCSLHTTPRHQLTEAVLEALPTIEALLAQPGPQREASPETEAEAAPASPQFEAWPLVELVTAALEAAEPSRGEPTPAEAEEPFLRFAEAEAEPSASDPRPSQPGLAPLPSELLPGWERGWDPQRQRAYFFNRSTRERTWRIPRAPTKAEDAEQDISTVLPESDASGRERRERREALELPAGWQRAWDVHRGRYYYFHRAMGKRTWTRPVMDDIGSVSHPGRGQSQKLDEQNEFGQEELERVSFLQLDSNVSLSRVSASRSG